jgi:hypothetical protein
MGQDLLVSLFSKLKLNAFLLGGALGPFTAGQLPAKFLFPMVMISDAIALIFLARLIKQDLQKIIARMNV